MTSVDLPSGGTGFEKETGARPSGTALAPLLQILLARAPEIGITRLGDITGLDRIGIPVVQAVRPLGLANAVTQGKGIDIQSAAISAILEAAEQFFAERIERLEVTHASAAELGIAPELFSRHLLPGAPPSWHADKTAWVRALDLISGDNGWLPLEMVHTAYSAPGLETDGIFSGSTTGLGCGVLREDAIRHALLECLERDAIARAERRHGFFQLCRIHPATAADAGLQNLIKTVEEAGLVCAFWLAPSPGDLPVVWCQVMEDGRRPLMTPYPADGFAADFDPIRAARRALLEAAQSRLAAISGTRDDISRAAYPAHTDWEMIHAHRRLLAEGPMPLSFDHLRKEGPKFRGDPLQGLLSHLGEKGMGPVLTVDFDTDPLAEIAAVRVAVPQLSPLAEVREGE